MHLGGQKHSESKASCQAYIIMFPVRTEPKPELELEPEPEPEPEPGPLARSGGKCTNLAGHRASTYFLWQGIK